MRKISYVVMNRRGGEFAIVSETGRERERFPVIYGAHILVKDGQEVESRRSAGHLGSVYHPDHHRGQRHR